MRLSRRMAGLLLCLALLLGLTGPVLAAEGGLTITRPEAAEPAEAAQFPFQAETGELAVTVRSGLSAKSAAVGRLERGEQLTVCAAAMNGAGEVWYAVELADGTQGYVRSDLLLSAQEAEAARAANPAPQEPAQRQYIGNRNTKKFHLPSCHTLPAEKNRVYFSSRDEAVDQGYVPCKNCDP